VKNSFNWLKNNWKITIFAVILMIVAVVGVRAWTSGPEELNFQNPEVQTVTRALDITGNVDAKEKARLRFIAGGKLTYIGFKEGDEVKKWQTIATIDQAILNKQLQQDLNTYLTERWDWEDTQDEIKDQSLGTSEKRAVDQQQWRLDNTVLNVEIRDIAIRNTHLFAPFSGILTSAPTSVAGMQVLASDYFEMINPNTMVFRAFVDESDVSQVSIGQKAKLVLNSYPDLEIETEVSYISFTSVETISGTSFIVEFPLSSDSAEILRIGMNGDIEIVLEEKADVLTVPLIAIAQRNGKNYVQVKTGPKTFEDREITLGIETYELAEVLSGLSEKDEVVIPE
jgi:RND family efflux transporter MFP subunit